MTQSNHEEITEVFGKIAMLILAVLAVVWFTVWMSSEPESQKYVSQPDPPIDCYTFNRNVEFYKQTYGKAPTVPDNVSRHCSLDNPFATKYTVHGDGEVWEVTNPAIVKWTDRGQPRADWSDVAPTLYCKSLPCKQ